jgi:hypothetical protein
MLVDAGSRSAGQKAGGGRRHYWCGKSGLYTDNWQLTYRSVEYLALFRVEEMGDETVGDNLYDDLESVAGKWSVLGQCWAAEVSLLT